MQNPVVYHVIAVGYHFTVGFAITLTLTRIACPTRVKYSVTGSQNLVCMTLYVTSVLFLSSKYRFPGVYFYLFLVLVSTYLVVVYTFNYRSLCSICNRISSFSFSEFYNNLVYSLEYVFLVFDILLQSLVNCIVFCIILLQENIQFTLCSFGRSNLSVVPVYFILFYFIFAFFSNKLFWKILQSFSFLPLTAPSCYTYKTFWIDALKGNTHLREWTFENFQKRQIRSFSRYVQWISIARLVT